MLPAVSSSKSLMKSSRRFKYNPLSIPAEFQETIPSDFLEGLSKNESQLMDPINIQLQFLESKILIRICEFLEPTEFLDLSLTCYFLHWRIFTFCHCYIPVMKMSVKDLDPGNSEELLLKIRPKFMQKNPRHLYFECVILAITIHEATSPDIWSYLIKKILPIRKKIEWLIVTIKAVDFNMESKHSSLWNDFLAAIKANGFKMNGEECHPSILAEPFSGRMHFICLKIAERDRFSFNLNKVSRLKHPFGIYINFPTWFVFIEVERFRFGQYVDFRCHKFVINQNPKVSITRQLEGEAPCCLGFKCKDLYIRICEEERAIYLCRGTNIHAELNAMEKEFLY